MTNTEEKLFRALDVLSESLQDTLQAVSALQDDLHNPDANESINSAYAKLGTVQEVLEKVKVWEHNALYHGVGS